MIRTIQNMGHTPGFYSLESQRTGQESDTTDIAQARIDDINRHIDFAHAQAHRNTINRIYNDIIYVVQNLRTK